MPDDAPNSLSDATDQLREEWIRETEQQLQNIQSQLGLDDLEQDRPLPDPLIERSTYMRRLQAQLRMDSRPSRTEPTDDPFGDYISDVAYTIEEGADRIQGQLEQERQGVSAVSGDVVCCVVNGLYLLLRRTGKVSKEEANEARKVAEEDLRKWLLLLRDLLKSFRSTLTGFDVGGNLSGLMSILQKDLTQIIMEGIEASIASLMFSVHEMVSRFAREVDKEVTSAIHETRCAPLLRIWGAIYDALFGGASSVIARTRGYLRDVLLKQARKRRKAVLQVGLGGELSGERRRRLLQRTDQLIALLDALLSAVSVFDLCRVDTRPPRGSSDDSDGEPRGDDTGRDSGGSSGRDETGRTRNDVTREPSDRRGGTGRVQMPDGDGSLTETEDPDLGRVGVLNAEGQTNDYLYLTPTNTAKFMVKVLDVSPEEALATVRDGNCRDELSQETEDILQDMGLIDQ